MDVLDAVQLWLTWLVNGFLGLLWLAVCARQDLRSRQVSNCLTIPPLAGGLLYAAAQGWEALLRTTLVLLTAAVLFHLGGMGGADVKILTALAAFSPLFLLAALLAQGAAGLVVWRRQGGRALFPAVPAYAAGAGLSFVIQFVLPFFTGGLS
jgi:hypothetical protein